jgi:hypothetical protein
MAKSFSVYFNIECFSGEYSQIEYPCKIRGNTPKVLGSADISDFVSKCDHLQPTYLWAVYTHSNISALAINHIQ